MEDFIFVCWIDFLWKVILIIVSATFHNSALVEKTQLTKPFFNTSGRKFTFGIVTVV